MEIQRAREQGYKDGIKFTVKNYNAVLLLCLKDKFNFSTEQLGEVVVLVNGTFDSVCKGYLTLEDIVETLREEDDINLTYNGVVQK